MTTIISKSGTGPPASDKLETAELAVDTSNGDLYTKLADGISVVQIGGGSGSGGGVEEAPIDTKQYARQDGSWSEIVIPDGGTGSSVHIGENPPADPQEGQQWMEVPANGDATMWIYALDADGNGFWLQQPGGKDGAKGADGNIQDGADNGSQDGIIATWSSADDQWRANTAVTVDTSGDATFSGNALFQGGTEKNGIATTTSGTLAEIQMGTTPGNSGLRGLLGFARDTGIFTYSYESGGTATEHLSIDQFGNATLSGTVTTGGGIVISKSGGCFVETTDPDSGIRWRSGVNPSGKWYVYQPASGGYDAVTALSILPGTGNALFAGTVSDGSGPLMSKRGLISTLSTLRKATMDETRDIRESLRSAIDELVAGLEHEISIMPAEDSE